MRITTSNLTRAAGLAAVAAGLIFVVVQPFHPDADIASVTTSAWAIVHSLTLAMAVLGLVGVAGIYLRQVRETGLLGLVGMVLLGLWFVTVAAFTFVEAFVLPELAKEAPRFVESFLAIFAGAGGERSLGVLNAMSPLSFALYLFGGVTFGVAVWRAGILARGAGALLAAGTASTLLLPLLPQAVERVAAVPAGLALMWLGHSLYTGRRATAGGSEPGVARSRLTPAAAD